MTDTIISIRDLCFRYGRRAILDHLEVDFARGETVLIAGQNGCGKSTFLKCLAGVLQPDQGLLDTGRIREHRKMGFISDKMSLLEQYTLAQGIRFHCRIFDIAEFNDELLRSLDLDLDARIKTLSTGERAIYHLSLLISQKPELLLIDEIIHTIDPFLRDIFLESLIGLMDEAGTTVIMVNHTFSSTGKIPERILLMQNGRFILDEKRDTLSGKVKKIILQESPSPDIPVIFAKRSSLFTEYYIYPYESDLEEKVSAPFQPIRLEDTIKAFIGGHYGKKRDS